MRLFIIAHGCYINDYNKTIVPNKCSITCYSNHGEVLSFDKAYSAVRSFVDKDSMDLEEAEVIPAGGEINDYILYDEGQAPFWPDLGVASLGLFVQHKCHEPLVYLTKGFAGKRLSDIIEAICKNYNGIETNCEIILISCRSHV